MAPLDVSSPDLTPNHIPLLPSSGITRRLLSSLLSSSAEFSGDHIDIASLLMFVAEGDNRADAHALARCVVKGLEVGVREEDWKEPISWRIGLYGEELGKESAEGGPAELYG